MSGIDKKSEIKLSEILNGEIVTIDTKNSGYLNPFEIDEKPSRQEVLSRIKALTVIENKHGKIVNFDLIKEFANKNGFEITDDEINDILNV